MWQISFLAIFSTKWLKILQKTWRAGQWTLKFCVHKVKVLYRKSLENTKIIWAALHCENDIWNKQIFAMRNCLSDQVSNILTDISCMVQLVPMNYNGFFGNFTAASGCFQLVPKYKLKVKLIKNKHPNIFVWNKSVSRKWEPRLSFLANP